MNVNENPAQDPEAPRGKKELEARLQELLDLIEKKQQALSEDKDVLHKIELHRDLLKEEIQKFPESETLLRKAIAVIQESIKDARENTRITEKRRKARLHDHAQTLSERIRQLVELQKENKNKERDFLRSIEKLELEILGYKGDIKGLEAGMEAYQYEAMEIKKDLDALG